MRVIYFTGILAFQIAAVYGTYSPLLGSEPEDEMLIPVFREVSKEQIFKSFIEDVFPDMYEDSPEGQMVRDTKLVCILNPCDHVTKLTLYDVFKSPKAFAKASIHLFADPFVDFVFSSSPMLGRYMRFRYMNNAMGSHWFQRSAVKAPVEGSLDINSLYAFLKDRPILGVDTSQYLRMVPMTLIDEINSFVYPTFGSRYSLNDVRYVVYIAHDDPFNRRREYELHDMMHDVFNTFTNWFAMVDIELANNPTGNREDLYANAGIWIQLPDMLNMYKAFFDYSNYKAYGVSKLKFLGTVALLPLYVLARTVFPETATRLGIHLEPS